MPPSTTSTPTMPTFESESTFLDDDRALTREQKGLFRVARTKFVADLRIEAHKPLWRIPYTRRRLYLALSLMLFGAMSSLIPDRVPTAGVAASDPRHLSIPSIASGGPTQLSARALLATAVRLSWTDRPDAVHEVERWDGATRKWVTVGSGRRIGVAGAYTGDDLTLATDDDLRYRYRVCRLARGAPVGVETCSPVTTAGRQFDHPANFSRLDYGIYWTRCGVCRPGDHGSDEVRAYPGEDDAYFNPRRPTVIFVHGWEPGSTAQAARQSMQTPIMAAPPREQDLAAPWRARGYNVGLFYWNQFADDTSSLIPTGVERKIWTADGGLTYLTRRADGSLVSPRVYPDPASVADLFVRSYLTAMRGYRGASVRFVGHSLGNQLAVRAAYLLQGLVERRRIAPTLLPRRIALLDPFYSSGVQSYLPRANESTAGEVTRETAALQTGPARTVFEYYSTSLIPVAADVAARMALVRVSPAYAGLDVGEAHLAAIHWYFASLAYPPLPACASTTTAGACVPLPRGGRSPSAAMSDAALAHLRGSVWTQVVGQNTPAVGDDRFQRH